MVCPNCNAPTSRLIIDEHGKACARCRGMSEAGGASTTNVLTRSSSRVRDQQRQHEGDTILPHSYDKASKKVIPNPDFVKAYPEQLPTYFSQSELQDAGYANIKPVFDNKKQEIAKVEAQKQDGVTFKPGTPKLD